MSGILHKRQGEEPVSGVLALKFPPGEVVDKNELNQALNKTDGIVLDYN